MFVSFLNRRTRHRLLTCLVLLAGLLMAGAYLSPASAQQSASPTADTTARANTTADASASPKSPGLAVGLSVGGTMLLTPVYGVGLIVGPSFGHFYAGDYGQALGGIALRTGGAGLAIGFWITGIVQQTMHDVEPWGLTAARVTASVAAIQLLYDVVTAWHSATAYNEAHGLSAQVTPTVGPRGEQVGLSLRVSF